MRTFPDDDDDLAELAQLNAEPWMIELLRLNPEYVFWGPSEDYMTTEGQWCGPVRVATWKQFDWQLNTLNECVNFYFEIVRASEPCSSCEQSGYNPATSRIANDFYDFSGTGRRWCDDITEDELQALQAEGRVQNSTLAAVNGANRKGSIARGGFSLRHDAISRHILIETRARRLGVFGLCSECQGEGNCYTAPAAHVELVLWMLHPRKGSSRGVQIQLVEHDDLVSIRSWLGLAAERNAQRFDKVLRSIALGGQTA